MKVPISFEGCNSDALCCTVLYQKCPVNCEHYRAFEGSTPFKENFEAVHLEKDSDNALLRFGFPVGCDSRGRAGIRGVGGSIGLVGQSVFPVVSGFVHRFVSATKKALTTATSSPVRESRCLSLDCV